MYVGTLCCGELMKRFGPGGPSLGSSFGPGGPSLGSSFGPGGPSLGSSTRPVLFQHNAKFSFQQVENNRGHSDTVDLIYIELFKSTI